jgi:hypothetical protein
MYLVTADEMQRMDRATIESFGIPGRVLMENAGRGATAFFLDAVYRHHPGTVGIAAGRGNNGGDGFVMARYLHQKGIRVTVFLLARKRTVKGDAAANLKLLDAMGVPVVEIVDEHGFQCPRAADAPAAHLDRCDPGHGPAIGCPGILPDGHRFHQPTGAAGVCRGHRLRPQRRYRAGLWCRHPGHRHGHLRFCQKSAIWPIRDEHLPVNLKIIEIGIPPPWPDVGCRQHLITPGA